MKVVFVSAVLLTVSVFRAWALNIHSALNQDSHQDQPLVRAKRLTITGQRGLWTKGIVPYVFDDSLPKERIQEYKEKVFPVYEKLSCIRFVPRTDTTAADEGLDHNNYLIFEQKSRQCSSSIGNTRKRGQSITCCYWKTCLHEVGHALGLYHEHQSPVRDEYVRINYENIKSGVSSAFSKENGDTHGVYDFESIMHYGLKAWSSNSEPTISLLEDDLRSRSQFANQNRYYYLFKEINELYQCTDGCDVTCDNGGYPAKVNGRCTCRCPEGLSGASSCRELKYADYKCGDIIDLTDQQPKIRILSPEIRDNKSPVTCYWFIRSPEKSRILLDFRRFRVRQQNGECVDQVDVRHYLPGMSGIPYCGDVFTQTIQSHGNLLAFSFTQTPSSGGISEFVADARYIPEEDFCYSIENKGRYYNGDVWHARDSSVCLPWYEVLHCKRNLFNVRDAGKNLKHNYCRNPDQAKGPWCYTEVQGCVRSYCDACNFGVCKDLNSQCSDWIQKDSSYCSKDPEAPRDCRRTCQFCNDRRRLPSVKTTFCPAPSLPADARSQTFLDKYSVGDTVTVECATSPDYQTITCLSNGEWTPLKYVCGSFCNVYQTVTCLSNGEWTHLKYFCGTCKPGWTMFAAKCYRVFDYNKKRGNADDFCSSQYEGGSLAIVNISDKHEFVTSLISNSRGTSCAPVWIGLKQVPDTENYAWDDGVTDLKWTNWVDENTPKGLGCVAINSKCAWADKSCGERLKFVCTYKPAAPIICADQRDDCQTLKQNVPDFCKTYGRTFSKMNCAKTCEIC